MNSVELNMHDRQQLTSRAEANRGLSLLLIPGCVLQDKEGVIEDGHGFLEGDAVFGASVLEDTVHELHCTTTYLQCKYRAGRTDLQGDQCTPTAVGV